MEAINKLSSLSCLMELEPDDGFGSAIQSVPLSTKSKKRSQNDSIVISTAQMPGGKQIKLLKTLLTSACERNCNYCPFRSGRDFQRVMLKPEEMANMFMSLHKAGIAEGIFLSSGIAGGGVYTQDKLIDTADILRTKLGYRGYLHLKLMPGLEKEQVFRAMCLSSRVSVNLEAPNQKRLELLAPRKTFLSELLQPLRWFDEIRRDSPPYHGWYGRWPSATTQFVVGAAGENDQELLNTTASLYSETGLSRVYYSIFNPVKDTPFEGLPAGSTLRGHRLYQSSFLLRDYGFRFDELPFDTEGNLPIAVDPKTAWAKSHLADNPIEINLASYEELLRIPGIGPKGAMTIIKARRQGRLNSLSDLKRIGVNPKSSTPFILLDGKLPYIQSSFW